MTRPSSGVNPIDVSTDCPPRIAAAEAPLPRCRTIRLVSAMGLPNKRAASRLTKACEVPWNPYRRMSCSSRQVRGMA